MNKKLIDWLESAAKLSAKAMPICVHVADETELKFAEKYIKGKAKFREISLTIGGLSAPRVNHDDADADLL